VKRLAQAIATVLLLCTIAHAGELKPVIEQPAVTVVPKMSGDLVTLNVDGVDIGALLRLLSETRHVSIVAGPEVSGPVSINLYKVPFAQALESILGVAGFTHFERGGVIHVTTPDSRVNLPPNVHDVAVRSFRINHADPTALLETLEQFVTDYGTIVQGPGKTIVVRDDPFNVEMVADLIQSLDVPPRQVVITTKIINVKRDDNRDIGVGFDTAPFTLYGVEALAAGFARYVTQAAVADGSLGLFLGTAQKDHNIYLEALDQRGDIDVLASPTVLALDGELARLQIGERLGFRITTSTQTSSLESVEFLDVGTVLEVTPSIADGGLIRMDINPKVSQGNIDQNGLPSEDTTELDTSMLVRNGETIVIGGLLNATKLHVRSQIPFLGDIPYIGKLFGKNSWIDDRSELVVLITPQIVGYESTPEMDEKIFAAQELWGEFGKEGYLTTIENEAGEVEAATRPVSTHRDRRGKQYKR
jgi:type IV pilus assembly protein PilQ